MSGPPANHWTRWAGLSSVLRVFLIGAVVLVLTGSRLPAPAAIQGYLLLPGIPGESTETHHPSWIRVVSFAESQLRPLMATNSEFLDLALRKPLDKASPRLARSCALRSHLASAELQLVTGDVNSAVFYDLQLSNVVVTSLSQVATSNAAPVEIISLGYDYVSWTYTVLTGSGMVKGNVEAFWNLVLNTGGSNMSPASDIGLRAYDGTGVIKLASEPLGVLTSPVRIMKGGTNYGIVLVDTNSPSASRMRIQTSSGVKAWQKLP